MQFAGGRVAAVWRLEGAVEGRSLALLRRTFAHGLPMLMLGAAAVHLTLADAQFSITARLLTAVPACAFLGMVASFLRQTGRPRLPFAPLALFQYYAAFGFPIFFNIAAEDLSGTVALSEAAYDSAALATALGAASMVAGVVLGGRLGVVCETPFLRLLPPADLPHAFGKVARVWVATMLIVGAARAATEIAVPAGLGYVAFVVFSVPLAMAIVFVMPRDAGRGGRSEVWLYAALGAAVFGSMVSGMIESAIRSAIAWIAGSIALWRTFRVGLLVLFGAAYMLVSPVKHEYRRVAWNSGRDLSIVERALVWRDAAAAVSEGSAASAASTDRESSTASGIVRMAELASVAHAMELVPAVIDYEYGISWVHILTSPIPRLVWPGKPTTQDLAQRYGVVFGRQTDEGAGSTALLEPLLVDGFWNFGWVGILIAPALVGLWYGVAAEILRGPHWACGMIGVAMLSMNTAHGALTVLYNGLVQQLFVFVLVAWGLFLSARAQSWRGRLK